MKWIVCIALLIIAIHGSSAEKNKEFQERAKIYSRLTDCDYIKSSEYNYTNFIELSSLVDAQPTGYHARIPIYVIGPRDAYISLSTTNKPNPDSDFVYEFVFGSYDNSAIMIRKRFQNYPLKSMKSPPVIPELRPWKLIIEVAKNGHIQVFAENKPVPIIAAFDPFVLPIKYLSFSGYQGVSNEFLYNCGSDPTTIDNSNEIQKHAVAPSISDLSQVPLDVLVEKCKVEEAWELQYNKPHELKTLKNSQADGYIFKLNFFVFGEKDVHILLSTTENPDIERESAYEIVIAGYSGTRQMIRGTKEGDDLFEKVQLKDVISEEQQSRILIQMTKDGLIEVFVGEFQYKPLIKVVDPKPIEVKYVNFASNDGSRVLFFYDCNDDDKAMASISPPLPPHPLFAEPINYDEGVLAANCKHLHAWEDTYVTPIQLGSLKNSKPEGFSLQLPLFVKGVRDAHILITPDNSLNPKDGYEIVIGGWGDSKHLIRKNGEVVAKVKEFNVLNEFKPIKLVVELTQSGEMRVFTEANKSVPLLEFKDSQPIENLNQISFSAYYRNLDFYYDCSA